MIRSNDQVARSPTKTQVTIAAAQSSKPRKGYPQASDIMPPRVYPPGHPMFVAPVSNEKQQKQVSTNIMVSFEEQSHFVSSTADVRKNTDIKLSSGKTLPLTRADSSKLSVLPKFDKVLPSDHVDTTARRLVLHNLH